MNKEINVEFLRGDFNEQALFKVGNFRANIDRRSQFSMNAWDEIYFFENNK